MGVIRSCGSCPEGAAFLVCHVSHALPTFQHSLSPVPVVHDLIGTGKETSLFCDSILPSQHKKLELNYEVWVIDCTPRQAYNIFIIMAPCERCEWVWGNTPSQPCQYGLSQAQW